MMSCTEMITMCLQAAKYKDRRPGKPLPVRLPGFIDIFRRADKNDDGKLSLEEFKAYFADGVLGSFELQELFHEIDKQCANNLDTEELCEYFSEHMGEFESVLSALEQLNISVLGAMDKTKKEYQTSSALRQFVTRFLLRETMEQLQSLQSSLECAIEAVGEQSSREREEPQMPEPLSVHRPVRRCGRRAQKTFCLSPSDPFSGILHSGVHVEPESQWVTQVNRLQQLVDRLEWKTPRLEPLKEELIDGTSQSQLMVVQRQMSVLEEEVEEFRQDLKRYVKSAANQSGSLHISVQKLRNESRFIVYEFWQDRASWRSHLQANHSKAFQRKNVDFLETPELMTTMLLPASWWIISNNN
ncbi:N-terminal EF-hand calcium-binding protein 1 [Callorhinchus milii]|nr:N-terminal EF-hand calcium-binding protein 1 [Callorhinchus milii]|eukprot:gi/632980105/ref/XP_007906846.1/ PREDICTED: N-terminal EF-hand calcium-binding protein 3 isoform X2 [Callorhinchus milii]